MADDVALKWAGNYDAQGRPVAFFAGVPARDLSPAEVDALRFTQAERDELILSGLYKEPAKKAAGKKDGD